MRHRYHQLPPEASEPIRQVIIQALKDHEYSFTGYGRRYLRDQQFDPCEVVDCLQDYLESGFRLYRLLGPSIKGVKYQCCLQYEGLIVHTKIFQVDESDDESWHATLSFKTHDTGGPPLPP